MESGDRWQIRRSHASSCKNKKGAMDGCISNRNEVFSDGELAPCARIRKTYMPSITGVPECLKLRERCRIRARIHRKLLRDEADLPPWFLDISTPWKATNQFGPSPLQARLRPSSRVLQSPPPRIPPAAPLEWSLTTTRARPFGLEAQAQRGSSLVLRLGLASGICCARVILPQVRGLILKGRGCMEKHKLIRLGANLQRISLEIAISIPEFPKCSV